MRRPHFRFPLFFVLGAALLTPGAVVAEEGFRASVDRVWVRGDSLRVDYQVTDLLSERIRDGLSRGLPMTYTVNIQFWRDRSGWWDSLVDERTIEFRIQRNVWNDRYLVVTGQTRSWLPEIDTLEHTLSRRRGEFVSTTNGLNPEKSYYVVLTPTLRPLTVEDLDDVENWLSGEFEDRRKRNGFSILTGLPRSVFSVFVDVAGLGDKSTLARSGRFRIEASATE